MIFGTHKHTKSNEIRSNEGSKRLLRHGLEDHRGPLSVWGANEDEYTAVAFCAKVDYLKNRFDEETLSHVINAYIHDENRKGNKRLAHALSFELRHCQPELDITSV